MEPKVFSEIEEVNRLHLSHYWLKTKKGTKPSAQSAKDRIFFSGDCGEPEHYRAELLFQQVLYLDCPLQLFSAVHWRMARPDEKRSVFPAEIIFEPAIQSLRQSSQVYCLDVGVSVAGQKRSSARNLREEDQVSQDHLALRTFFIVASRVEISVHYAGDDLETYLEHVGQKDFPDPREGS